MTWHEIAKRRDRRRARRGDLLPALQLGGGLQAHARRRRPRLRRLGQPAQQRPRHVGQADRDVVAAADRRGHRRRARRRSPRLRPRTDRLLGRVRDRLPPTASSSPGETGHTRSYGTNPLCGLRPRGQPPVPAPRTRHRTPPGRRPRASSRRSASSPSRSTAILRHSPTPGSARSASSMPRSVGSGSSSSSSPGRTPPSEPPASPAPTTSAQPASSGPRWTAGRSRSGSPTTPRRAPSSTRRPGAFGASWGAAVRGPLVGRQLDRVAAHDHFWFAWAAFRPEQPPSTGAHPDHRTPGRRPRPGPSRAASRRNPDEAGIGVTDRPAAPDRAG